MALGLRRFDQGSMSFDKTVHVFSATYSALHQPTNILSLTWQLVTSTGTLVFFVGFGLSWIPADDMRFHLTCYIMVARSGKIVLWRDQTAHYTQMHGKCSY